MGPRSSPLVPKQPVPAREHPETSEIRAQLSNALDALEKRPGGRTLDAPALVDALRTFEPGMVRQPAGAAQKVLHLLSDGNYSGSQLAATIESDPAIAQSLLRHANASWYDDKDNPPVTSLVAAARRVGTKGVHAAVMSVVMEGGFARPGAGLDSLASKVWDHMVRVAPMARQLGDGFGADPDTAFTLGLCHDVGKLILFDQIAELRRRLRRDLRFPQGFLSDVLRNTHEPLGGAATLAWGLPGSFARIVASHHRTPPPTEPSPLSEAIFIVERLDYAIQDEAPYDLEELWERGRITIPFDLGRRLVWETDQAAVEAKLEERARALQAASAQAEVPVTPATAGGTPQPTPAV